MEGAFSQLIAEWGAVGALITLMILGGIYILRYFMVHCEKRTETALTAYKEESEKNRDVIGKNTSAFHGVQVALIELKGKVER